MPLATALVSLPLFPEVGASFWAGRGDMVGTTRGVFKAGWQYPSQGIGHVLLMGLVWAWGLYFCHDCVIVRAVRQCGRQGRACPVRFSETGS